MLGVGVHFNLHGIFSTDLFRCEEYLKCFCFVFVYCFFFFCLGRVNIQPKS
jgi:hypothetical protein